MVKLARGNETFAGSREMQVRDEALGLSFPVLVLYPTRVPSSPAPIGQHEVALSPDAPLAPGRHPLVLVSHGSGGSSLLHQTIASRLARSGYVVALPEHPGNNRDDNALKDSDDNLVRRCRHLSLTIDAVASEAWFKASVQSDRVAVIGHSMGGCTGLALAGGTPWSKAGHRIALQSDRRVQALVLLAPATAWYLPAGALSDVTMPILMLIAEHDALTPPWHAELVLNGVPDRAQVTCRVVENAGHFSFLDPFPPARQRPGFAPATDPPGFDREAFHERLGGELLEFLNRTLPVHHDQVPAGEPLPKPVASSA